MALKITNSKSDQLLANGTFAGAKGGTELMMDGLISRLDPKLFSKFNIVSSRVSETSITPDRFNIYWCHETVRDPSTHWLHDADARNRFDKLVFVSNHQLSSFQQVLGVPYSESCVLQNAIVPIANHKKPTDRINLAYTSTPHRGLELLVPVFEKLYEHFGDRIHLDVYSSFKLYGWEQRDVPFKDLFDRCRAHPGISYHGTVSNEDLKEALKSTHIWAYPSIYEETSCISAMEAMSAGCLIVAPNLGALPETLANFGVMYQWNEDRNIHARQFASVLAAAITEYNVPSIQERITFQKAYADTFYDWDLRIQEWTGLLNGIVKNVK